jgi:signal transduction histidine kinase
MNLLQRNTRFLLKWLPIVLLACCILFYFLMRIQAHHMQEKQLFLKQLNVWNAFTARLGNMDKHIAGEYDIMEGEPSPRIELDEPRDTSIYYEDKKKSLPFQILTSKQNWNDKTYQITTYVSSTEISHLIIKVFITEVGILILLLLALVILNRRSSGFLWKPFFSTMKTINAYDITRSQRVQFPTQTGTSEFDELNKSITQLITNVNNAYHHQKEFVDNASHEMQTPLAIIRSKLELLINQPGLTEKTASILADITDANNRLNQMNRTLLLLAKIENNQFPDTEQVNISQVVFQTIEQFQKHADGELPRLSSKIESDVIVQANSTLIEILISNLIKNAIVHNIPGGKIDINISETELEIKNTGPIPEIATEQLFDRFMKGSHQSKTTGLGLALVKQICALYQFDVSYHFADSWHILRVKFR